MGSKILILVAVVLLLPNNSSVAKDSSIPPSAAIREIMEDFVMPAADVLWDATAIYITEEGEEDHSPKNDEEWRQVDQSRIALEEAIRALLVSGRHVDERGPGAENEEGELNPDQIEAMIKSEPEVWVAKLGALDDIVQQAKKAIEDQDVEALTEIGGTLDEACEGCHTHFWYPDE